MPVPTNNHCCEISSSAGQPKASKRKDKKKERNKRKLQRLRRKKTAAVALDDCSILTTKTLMHFFACLETRATSSWSETAKSIRTSRTARELARISRRSRLFVNIHRCGLSYYLWRPDYRVFRKLLMNVLPHNFIYLAQIAKLVKVSVLWSTILSSWVTRPNYGGAGKP